MTDGPEPTCAANVLITRGADLRAEDFVLLGRNDRPRFGRIKGMAMPNDYGKQPPKGITKGLDKSRTAVVLLA